MKEPSDYDPDRRKYYLGSLCVYKHEYKDTRKSTRYSTGGTCVYCGYLSSRARRQGSKSNAYHTWRKEHRVKLLKYMKVKAKEAKERNPEKIRKYNKEYYLTKTKPSKQTFKNLQKDKELLNASLPI